MIDLLPKLFPSQLRFAIYSLGRLIHVRWDIFHRAVNDVKLALAGAGSGFLSAQMHSSYLWALPYRPFGSGGFMEEKKRMIQHFMSCHDSHYGPFQENLEQFESDLGLEPHLSAEDVFHEVCSVPGFQTKGTLPKLGRWFSWNQSHEESAREFRVFRMVLRHWLGSEAAKLDPNEAAQARELAIAGRASQKSSGNKESLRSEFGRLKEKLGGGMKLAYYLMSDKLLVTVNILAAATRPTWTLYADTVKEVKTPDDTVKQTMKLQQSWASDPHLVATAAVLTECSNEVVRLFQDRDLSQFKDSGAKLFRLVTMLLKHRAWSFFKQYSAPPDCYAQLLGDSKEAQDTRPMFIHYHNEFQIK